MDEQQWRNEATLDAPDTPAAAVTTVPVAASKPKRRIPWLWVWIGMGLLILGTAILIILWLRQTVEKSRLSSRANDVKIQSVDLGSISGNSSSIDLNTADKVVINGQLQSNEGIVITPTAEPAVATLGQLYVDQGSREIRFYNGDGFVSLLTSDEDFVTQGEVQALIAANTPAATPQGVTSLQGQTGPLSLLGTGGLTITGAGGNITLNLPQNLTVTSNPIFAGMTLSGLDANGVVVTGAGSALESVTAVSPGLCLISTGGLPVFDSCVGGGASVASLNGLTGALILANASATSGDTITIDNASTTTKGIAQFNSTNFSASSGTINTIQDIATTSTPTFAGVLTNSIDRATAGTLTLGATTATAISLNKNTTVAGGSSLTVSGGNFSQTGSGTFSTGTGAVSLNGTTTVASGRSFTALGEALFRASVDSQTAFRIQNSSLATVLGVDTTSVTNMITNSTFESSVSGWAGLGAPTPTPSTFAWDADNSYDSGSGSLNVVNNGSSVQGAGFAVPLTGGQQYTLTFYGRSNMTVNQSVQAGFYSGGTLAGASAQCTGGTMKNATLTSIWKIFSCTFTPGANADGIWIRSTRNNGNWYLDKVILQTGTYKPINNGIINANAATLINTDSDSAFRVQGSLGAYPVLNIDSNMGTAVFRPVVNDTDTLQVRNADDSLVFNVRAGAAGTLSSWSETSTQFATAAPRARNKFQGATAMTSTGDTYGYIIGGSSGSNNAQNTVFYTKLSGSGTETWQDGNSNGLPERQSHGVVTAKGYIYVIGGSDDSAIATNTVYYNKIASNGALELTSWQTASTLGTARTNIQAVYYQGYIYVFGGSASESGTALDTIERAVVNADGSLGSWTSSGTLPEALRNYAVTISNGYIYVIGGVQSDANRNDQVHYVHVDGPAGALGSWTTDNTNFIPQALDGASAVINSGYLYVMGGAGVGNGVLSTVYYTPVSAGGGIDVWSTSTLIDQNGTLKRRDETGVILYNNTIYLIGGNSGGGNIASTILYANASGTSSSVSINGALNVTTDARITGSLRVINATDSTSAFLVANALGGQLLNVDTLNNTVTLNGINSGELRNWLTTTELDNGRAAHGAVAVNGYLYAVSGSSSDTVSYAKIKTDGSLGEWADNAVNLPDYKNFAGVATSNGYIYMVGGYDSGSGDDPTDTIYYGKPNSDGSVSSWKTASSTLDTPVGAPAVSIVNGYIYVSGGATDSSSGTPTTPTDVVQYAKLNPDGSLGSFTTSGNSLPAARMGGRSAVANGYLYYTGGAASGGAAQDDVYFASLAGDGSVGSWTATNSNPDAKAYHTAFILNGYLYMLGGTDTSYGSSSTDSVDFGKLESDGDITQWFTTSEPLLGTVQSHASVVANGYVYVIGGYGPSKVVMFSTASRVSVGGSLDLVGLGSRTLSDAGGGGELTAGNTTIVGTLDVRNAATFSQSLSVNGIFTAHDDVLLQSDNDSANAFQVQNSSGTVLLGVNAAAGQVNVNADMLFGDTNNIYVNNIIQTAAGQDININAGDDAIIFTAGGRTFILPTTGPGAQTICTTGISCAEGGGQAVLLASGSAQTNNTTDSSIFINATNTGHHIQLQSSGTDVFVVDHNGVLTLGTPGSVGGSIVFSDGTSSYAVTLNVGSLTGNRTFSFPDSSSGEICVSSGNCAGAGSSVTAPVAGTTNRIAKFTAGQAIGDSNISDNGTAVTIQGTDGLVLGQDSTINGKIRFWYAGGSYSVVLETGGLTNDQTITLPDASGEICVSSGNCFGSGSGATLQAAYNAGNTITTSDNRNLTFTLADTTTDSNFIVNIQGANSVKFQDGGTDIFTAADGGVFTLKSTSNSSSAFVLQNNSNTALLTADASAMKLKIGTGTPTLGSATSGGLYVTDAAEFAGAIRIGDGTNNATFDGTTKQLRFSGTARNTKTIFMAAEYVNAVLDADGSNNIGTMTAGYDSSARMNYYKWTTSQGSSQDYDIVMQILVPRDFSAWSGNMTIKLCASNNTASAIKATITDTAGSDQTTQDIANTSGACTGYNSGTAVTLSGTYTPGSYFTLRLRLTSPTSGDIRVGNISMDYLSSF